MPTQAPVLHDAGPLEKTVVSITGIGADQTAKNLMLTPANAGMYRINCYLVNTTTGTGGDVLPDIFLTIADESGANAVYMAQAPGLTSGMNAYTTVPFWCSASTTITYTISGGTYAGGLKMAMHLMLETLV